MTLQFTLIKPCANCPFRTDKPRQRGWLGTARAEQIVNAICHENSSFVCHKTTGEDYKGDQIHCAGALIMMEHMQVAHHNGLLRIMERLGAYDHTKLDMESPVFQDSEDFIEWHDNDHRG